MLGKGGDRGGLAEVLGGYEALVDELLGDDDDGSGWIGTEEDILLMMMRRDSRFFVPVRSGNLRVNPLLSSSTTNSQATDVAHIFNNCHMLQVRKLHAFHSEVL